MIIIDSIRNAKQLVSTCDEVWLITRSPRTIEGVQWVPELSPSKQLFFDYRSWDKAGIWNETCFNEMYAPRFLQEIAANNDAREKLNELWHVNSLKGNEQIGHRHGVC